MTGHVVVEWQPGVALEIDRIKQAVLRWRGGVQYGGAEVTVVGVVQTSEPVGNHSGEGGAATGTARPPFWLLRATGTNQPFRLRVGTTGVSSSGFCPGQPYRVTGSVIKSEEGKEHAIVLEVERAEPLGSGR